MLYRTIKRLIELGTTDGLSEKLEVFLEAGKLSKEEYTELETRLSSNN